MANKKQEHYGISTPLLRRVIDMQAIGSPTLREAYSGTLNIDLSDEILSADGLDPMRILRGLCSADKIKVNDDHLAKRYFPQDTYGPLVEFPPRNWNYQDVLGRLFGREFAENPFLELTSETKSRLVGSFLRPYVNYHYALPRDKTKDPRNPFYIKEILKYLEARK